MKAVRFLFVLFVVVVFHGYASGEVVNYTYDATGRITKVKYSNGSYIEYTYDKVGNRLSETVGTSVAGMESDPVFDPWEADEIESVSGNGTDALDDDGLKDGYDPIDNTNEDRD